jgi:hypothetical protein
VLALTVMKLIHELFHFITPLVMEALYRNVGTEPPAGSAAYQHISIYEQPFSYFDTNVCLTILHTYVYPSLYVFSSKGTPPKLRVRIDPQHKGRGEMGEVVEHELTGFVISNTGDLSVNDNRTIVD